MDRLYAVTLGGFIVAADDKTAEAQLADAVRLLSDSDLLTDIDASAHAVPDHLVEESIDAADQVDLERETRVLAWLRQHGWECVADDLEELGAEIVARRFQSMREPDDQPPWTADVLNALAEGDDVGVDVLLRMPYPPVEAQP